MRHSSYSQARRALGSRRPHSNRVSTSACDTRLNCIVVMSHILVWHYPPLVRSQRSNRVRHSSDSQARRALGSRRPHSNRVSTSACDNRLNTLASTEYTVLVLYSSPDFGTWSQCAQFLIWAHFCENTGKNTSKIWCDFVLFVIKCLFRALVTFLQPNVRWTCTKSPKLRAKFKFEIL